jgi:cation diffusion facilitator CzcD-associated flavoprotein CzcO
MNGNQNHATNVHHAYYLSKDSAVAIIGAGVAGVAAAAALHTAGYTNIVVYEKNCGIGGLWYQNYPGAAGTFQHDHCGYVVVVVVP